MAAKRHDVGIGDGTAIGQPQRVGVLGIVARVADQSPVVEGHSLMKFIQVGRSAIGRIGRPHTMASRTGDLPRAPQRIGPIQLDHRRPRRPPDLNRVTRPFRRGRLLCSHEAAGTLRQHPTPFSRWRSRSAHARTECYDQSEKASDDPPAPPGSPICRRSHQRRHAAMDRRGIASACTRKPSSDPEDVPTPRIAHASVTFGMPRGKWNRGSPSCLIPYGACVPSFPTRIDLPLVRWRAIHCGKWGSHRADQWTRHRPGRR